MGIFKSSLVGLGLLLLVAAVISKESGENSTERYEYDSNSNYEYIQSNEKENRNEANLNENIQPNKNEFEIQSYNINKIENENINNSESNNNETVTQRQENFNNNIKVNAFSNETVNNKNETVSNNNETESNNNQFESRENQTLSENNGSGSNENETDKMDIATELFQNNTEPNDFSFPIDPPNILIIMADDMGWNDVSFHGSNQIMTPNIDTLAYQGITIQQYYTDSFGTASRSAFFTGKYPSRLGTQSSSIKAFEDRGVPEQEKLLPSYLKDLGYSTHLVGKWALGKSRNRYLPINRGFDSFFGFLGGSVDYLTYNHIEQWNNTQFFGLDLYDNFNPVQDMTGDLTEILTQRAVQLIRDHNNSRPLYLQLSHAAPHAGGGLVNLQPPLSAISDNSHIAHSARRLYAGLVTNLDKSIGTVIAALAENDLLKNTLIVVASDNGAATDGPTQNFGSNVPLRGSKGTPWEGGVRSSAILWHPDITSDIWDGLFHVTDWVPTLVAAAGGNVTEGLDGVNQWNVMRNGEASKRKEVLISIDDLNGWAAIREGDYKLIVGDIKQECSNYHGKELSAIRFDAPPYENVLLDCETAKIMRENVGRDLNIHTVLLKRNDTLLEENPTGDDLCLPTKDKGCLFNLVDDPHEANDLWNESPDLTKHLTLRLRSLWAELIPRSPVTPDDRSNPAYHNYIWSPWLDDTEPKPEALTTPPIFPVKVSKGEVQYLVDININAFREEMYSYIQKMGNSFVKSVGGLFNFM